MENVGVALSSLVPSIHCTSNRFLCPLLQAVEVNVVVANGLGNAKKILAEVKEGRKNYHFIEVMACPGGCIGGGGQPRSKVCWCARGWGLRAAFCWAVSNCGLLWVCLVEGQGVCWEVRSSVALCSVGACGKAAAGPLAPQLLDAEDLWKMQQVTSRLANPCA
jgi:hypothetical protein